MTREEEIGIITSIRDGQFGLFDRFVDAYRHRLVRFLFLQLGSLQDAEDVAQESFLSAYRKLNRFEGRSSFYTWLHKIAHNLAIDRQRSKDYRNHRNQVSLTDHEMMGASEVENPAKQAESEETKAMIHQALMQIDEERRQVVVLRDLQGMDYSDIAEVLSIPIGTVRSRIHRARLELRPLLSSILASPLKVSEVHRSESKTEVSS